MSKKIIFGIVIVAVIVGGIALFRVTKDNTQDVKNTVAPSTESSEEGVVEIVPISGVDSLTSLMEMGQNLECKISYYPDENSKEPVTGTYFVSQNRMRGDFIVSGSGEGSVSSMIMKDDKLYSWTEIEGEKYGMMISLSELAETKSDDKKPEAGETVPLEVPVDYECNVWKNIDGSIFEPPTDVLFKNYSDVVNTGMEYGTSYENVGSNADQCALCEQVKGEGRIECRAAFSCQ